MAHEYVIDIGSAGRPGRIVHTKRKAEAATALADYTSPTMAATLLSNAENNGVAHYQTQRGANIDVYWQEED
jgi:hypothetical protein